MILITGAKGLVGSFLIAKFLEQGHSVRALYHTNPRPDPSPGLSGKIEWVKGDILDVSHLLDCMKGVDYVIHTAALVSYQPQDQERLYKTNVEGTANVTNAALRYPLKKMVFLSSVGALSYLKNQQEVDERLHRPHNRLDTHYGKSKYLAELEVWRGAAEGLPILIFNPSTILGPGDWEQGSTRIFKYIWEAKPYFSDGLSNYVDVRDLSEIICKLSLSPLKNERLIINAGQVPNKVLLSHIARTFGKAPPHKNLSGWRGEIAWRWQVLRSLFGEHTSLLNQESLKIARRKVTFSNEKLKQHIDYEFRKLPETIHWVCEQLINKYDLDVKP